MSFGGDPSTSDNYALHHGIQGGGGGGKANLGHPSKMKNK